LYLHEVDEVVVEVEIVAEVIEIKILAHELEL
jgi:hypothetical protein